MGLTYADITLANGADTYLAKLGRIPKEEVRKMKVSALADSGAYMLVINENIRTQLELPTYEQHTAKLADGSIIPCDIVGPVDILFENRATTCRAIVLPGDAQVLLGAIPIEDMDVLIDLKNNKLVVNPAHPYIAETMLVSVNLVR